VAVTYADIPSFCGNIAFVTFHRKTDKSRRHTEGKGRREAKGIYMIIFLEFWQSSSIYLVNFTLAHDNSNVVSSSPKS
jgi:hypothetical protein